MAEYLAPASEPSPPTPPGAPPERGNRDWRLPAIAAAVLLGITAGGVAYWLMERLGQGSTGMPTGAAAIPAEAVVSLTLTTDPAQWERLRTFGTPTTQGQWDQQLARWQDQWLGQYGLSFDQHLAPWVGEAITLVWLPVGEGATRSPGEQLPEDFQALAIVPIADGEALQAQRAAWPLTPAPAEQRDYRGVTLVPYGTPRGDTLWGAVLGNELLLVAPGVVPLERAIDAYRGANSLEDEADYRQGLSALNQAQPFAQIYFNGPQVAQWFARSAQPPFPSAWVAGLQGQGSGVALVGLTGQGVTIQGQNWLPRTGERRYETRQPLPSQIPQYLPANTVAVAVGANFQEFWRDWSQGRSWGALMGLNPEELAVSLQGSTGVVLEEDLLPGLGGAFALAIVPPPPTPFALPETTLEGEEPPLPSPGLVLLAEASDRPRIERVFSQLDGVMADRYRYEVQRRQVQGIVLTDWRSPFGGLHFTYGWLSQGLTFLALGEDTAAAMAPPPDRPLASQAQFQRVTSAAPSTPHGLFYLNLAGLRQGDGTLFLPEIPPENQALLAAVEAVGLTSVVVQERRLRYDLFVALATGERPGPLPAPNDGPDSGS